MEIRSAQTGELDAHDRVPAGEQLGLGHFGAGDLADALEGDRLHGRP
jgi:hypothetical protein